MSENYKFGVYKKFYESELLRLNCNKAKNNNNTEITGCPFFDLDKVDISKAPKIRIIPINTEKTGILEKESPKYIIANNVGMPNRFTSVLEELFFAIFALKQDQKFTRISYLIPKGLMNSLVNKKSPAVPGFFIMFYVSN